MQEGLYKVDFKTPRGQGFGVAYLAAGSVHGGDSSMFYVGSYTLAGLAGEDFRADVRVGTHSHIQGVTSVFGVPEAHIRIEGKILGDHGTLKGTSPQAPGIEFSATFTKVAD